jgi:rfaE bifunctional protein nucleotidyltransferase chain/domain
MGKKVGWKELAEAVATLRAEGRSIVFTNGCFDILHAGHVRYLREASKLGDILIVGLNSDKSVSVIKTGRPVNPEAQRAEVLSSLEMVDYVTIFNEETPYELIKLVRPDVLVKGGDWKKEDIIGNDVAGKTVSLTYIEGVSTTSIIEKIREMGL